MKKTPIRIRFWLNRPIRPARSGVIFISARCTSGSRPLLSRRPCHWVNAHSSARPAPTTKSVSEKPNGVSGESSLGLIQPQALDCSTPRTTSPRPVADRTVPTMSSFGAGPVRTASTTFGVITRISATSTTSPAKMIRHEYSVVAQPPRIGPTAIPAPATPPITAYATFRDAPSKLPAISATIAGSTSAAPSPSRIDQPRVSTATVGASAVIAEPHA